MTKLVLPLVVIACLVVAGCMEYKALASSYTPAQGAAMLEGLLSVQEFKEVADRIAPFTLAVQVKDWRGYEQVDVYRYADGNVSVILAKTGDFTLTTTESIALGVINADDRGRVFACAVNENAATLVPTNLIYAASFNAAKERILQHPKDCHAQTGQSVTYRGMSGVLVNETVSELGTPHAALMGGEWLVFNTWRAPVYWTWNSAASLCTAVSKEWASSVCGVGAGYNAPASGLEDCKKEVEKGYARPAANTFDTGLHVAQETKKSAELAACAMIYGGM